jgi:hypothetical protein
MEGKWSGNWGNPAGESFLPNAPPPIPANGRIRLFGLRRNLGGCTEANLGKEKFRPETRSINGEVKGMPKSLWKILGLFLLNLAFLSVPGNPPGARADNGEGICETYDQYVPLKESKTGILVDAQGNRLSQWGTRPTGKDRTDVVWGTPAHWPSSYSEEFGIKENFGGRKYVWQYAFRNDEKNVRYALRALKVILVTSQGSQQIVDADPEGIEGLPYALYEVCKQPYTIQVWGKILDTDGTSLLRRFYWQAEYQVNTLENPFWKGEGSKIRQVIRQSELWWDSHNGWVHGISKMGDSCQPCQILDRCLADCEKKFSDGASHESCVQACHQADQRQCALSSCWPTGQESQYGRAISNAKEVGFGWGYQDFERNIRMGLEKVMAWEEGGGGNNGPDNAIMAGAVKRDDRGRFSVPLRVMAFPRPKATVAGETALYVLKIAGSPSPTPPDPNVFASTNCSNTTPTQGKLFCLKENELPEGDAQGVIDLGTWVFNEGVSGTRYLWAIFHNDVYRSASKYWGKSLAWSAPIKTKPILLSDEKSIPVQNSLIVGSVGLDGQGRGTVSLRVKAVPRPQATVQGVKAQYVVKIIGSDRPTPPDLHTFASTNCTNVTPTQGKMFCLTESQLPASDANGVINLGTYTFNEGVKGTRYLHAIFHNDANQPGRDYWSMPVSSGPIQISPSE